MFRKRNCIMSFLRCQKDFAMLIIYQVMVIIFCLSIYSMTTHENFSIYTSLQEIFSQ